ncbi:MAG: hypothetical protein M1831_007204 [Alyxoria varia]|nr:MAG: hypothetical protein M1831_007204 [Alyxoria varia]
MSETTNSHGTIMDTNGINGTRGTNGTHTSTSATSTFSAIPTLHLASALPPDFRYTPTTPLPARRSHSPENAHKPVFLKQLRDALLHVGFFYLGSIDAFVPASLRDEVMRECWAFFKESDSNGEAAEGYLQHRHRSHEGVGMGMAEKKEEARKVGYLPHSERLKIEMKNDKTFLGWSRLDNEITASKPDHREQLDLATPRPIPAQRASTNGTTHPQRGETSSSPAQDTPKPHAETLDRKQYREYRPPSTAPLPQNLWGPNQWPSSEYLPHFRPVYTEYMHRMGALSSFMMDMIAESLGLDVGVFDGFFDGRGSVDVDSGGDAVDGDGAGAGVSAGLAAQSTEEQRRAFGQSHKLKLIKYPDDVDVDIEGEGKERGQGVGPHKDSMLTSYLLQASHHDGLQAQNKAGEWVDCPPREGTLVAAMGQGLEALTSGLCTSTTHRVLSPFAGTGPRYSIPFFQGVSFDAKFEQMNVPESVRALKEKAGERRDDVEFTFKPGRWKNLGEATLMNRVKSHRDVAEVWYPRLLEEVLGKG